MNKGATVESLMDCYDRYGQPVLKGERGLVKSIGPEFTIVEFTAARMADMQPIWLAPIYTPEETEAFMGDA